MYSKKIINAKAAAIESSYPIKLKEYSIAEVEEWGQRLKTLIHQDSTPNKPKLVRHLHEDEQSFVANECFMSKISFPYWATRYAYIIHDKGGVVRIRFKESQEMLLDVISKLEEAGQPAKILNLKARQVYASTFSELVLTHKVMNTPGITSVVASDEPEKSEILFNMMERIYDNLPFYLKPRRKYRVKGSQLYFDELDSKIEVDSGNKRVGGLGQGMAQPLDSKILTPFGWRYMCDIQKGDVVLGPSGKPTVVTGVYPQGIKDAYKVKFTDGTSTECCLDHLWSVKSAKDRTRKRNGKVVALNTIQQNIKGKRGEHNYFIPITEAVEYFSNPTKLDPYLLGVLLGDGCLTIKSRIQITAAYPNMVDQIKQVLPQALELKLMSGSTIDYRIAGTRSKHKNEVLEEITKLGLFGKTSHTKFIPKDYLQAAIKQREALLQGLLDTDGSVSKADNAVEFFSMSEQLTDGVVELVQSLGGTAKKKTRLYKVGGFRKKEGLGFVLRIALPDTIQPFRFIKKAAVYRQRTKYKPYRAIESIDFIGPKAMQCIAVAAEDALYITDSFIVTHNTIHAGHLSELATWQNVDQITADLIPAVISGESVNTFFIIEFTANGKSGAAYEWWKACKRKHFHGFIPVFIPWWLIKEKYAAAPTPGWGPSERVLKHAMQIKQTKGVDLSRKQMYWWDEHYASYKETGRLHEFFAEYAGDDQEAFQLTGKTVFDTELLNDLQRKAKAKTLAFYELQEKLVLK